jgi:hypothetical protein
MEHAPERAIQMYTCASHAHFATFATYVGATTVGMAAVGLGIDRAAAPAIIAVACLLGIWVCLQWHLASLSHRMWCRYYRRMITELQRDPAPGKLSVMKMPSDGGRSGSDFPWWYRREKKWTGTRGASLPAVYAVLFALMGTYAAFPKWFAAVSDARGKLAVVFGTLLVFFALIAYVLKLTGFMPPGVSPSGG